MSPIKLYLVVLTARAARRAVGKNEMALVSVHSEFGSDKLNQYIKCESSQIWKQPLAQLLTVSDDYV